MLKKNWVKKKETNFINFLNFIKNEDKRFFCEINLKGRNNDEILKFKNKIAKIKDDFTRDTDEDIIKNNSIKNNNQWLIYNNSYRFDVFMTLYLLIFKKIYC